MKKRFLSILMALCMMLTLAVPSVAAGDTVDLPIAETPVTQETEGGTEGQEPPETPETPETPEDSTPPASPEDAGEPEEGGETGDPSSGGEESVPPEEDNSADVARIESATYDTLDEAVEAAVEGATIVLLQDCELTKGFNKTLTFTGNGKITINKQLTSNGEAWMCFGLYDPSRELTFDGAGVEVEWTSEVGTAPWLMLSLSGTLTVTNGAKMSFTVDSGSTGSRNAIYMNAGSKINVSNGATFEIHGNETDGKEGQGIQLNQTGKATIKVAGGSTFLIDGTNRGYVNSPTIYVEDSTFTVQNCTSNASNGGQFTAINSSITYQNNRGHGLSAGDVTIQNSTLNCNENAYYGITYSGNMTMDATSAINANENGHGYTGGGLRAYGTSTVVAGAEINILNNKRNGMENYGTFTMEDGVKFTATGNHEPSTNGGGIYNGGTLTLPANAIVMNNYAEQTGGGICNAGTATIPGSVKLYNNHAGNAGDAGDDIYNRDSATITFGPVGTDWYLDGAPDCCYHGIDGWYDDSSGTRWEAHAAPEEGNHIEKFEGTADREGRFTITGLKALKAAHGTLDDGETTISIQPADIAIYTGGEGYESVVEGTREELDGQQSQGLPEPGYYITLPDWVNALIKNNDNMILLDENGAADLSDILSFSYNFNDETRRWTLKRYDKDGKSTAYGQYVYRLIPGTGQYNVRLQFSDGEETILSDVFTPALDQLYKKYTMTIYAGALEQQEVQATITLDGVTYPFDVEVVPGTLTIRGVTEDVETPLLNGDPSDNGFAAKVPQNTQYFINGSRIGINDASGIALLVDELVEGDSPIITNAVYHALNEKTLDTLLEEKGVVLSNPRYDYAYMNLVDTNNGNVYVQADQPVTVTWPYPAGTDAGDTFYLVHFQDMNRGENLTSGAIANSDVEVLEVNTTEAGLTFSVDGFSPFVLVWETTHYPPIDPNPNPDPDPDPTPDPDPEDPDKPELNTEDHYAYIVGYPDGNVKPEGNITRAEVATIFFRLLTDESRDEFWSQTNPYSDVSEDDWYNNAVSTLTNAGIIDGYEDGTFKPNGNITRAEFATIAVRFFEATYEGENLFPDIDGHWAQDYINEAANAGIVDGYPDGTFGPQKRITRAEAMTMVNRTIDRHPHEDHLLDDMIVWPDNPETAWYYEQVQEATNSHEYTMNTDDEQNPYEIWTELLPVRDWAQLEKEWSDAHSGQSGGDVV